MKNFFDPNLIKKAIKIIKPLDTSCFPDIDYDVNTREKIEQYLKDKYEPS